MAARPPWSRSRNGDRAPLGPPGDDPINDGIQAQAFDISSYKIAADELVAGSGATLLFHALAVGVAMADDHAIDAVLIESKSGRAAIRGRVFVDATGDGDVSAWAGVAFEKSDHLLYPSLMFRINGVDARARPGTSRGGPSSS